LSGLLNASSTTLNTIRIRLSRSAIVEAYPRSRDVNAVWNSVSDRTRVELPGPPPVMMKITSSARNTSMMRIKRAISRMLRIIGSFTCQVIFHQLAPSMYAASMTSPGSPCRPASTIMNTNGVHCHTSLTTIDTIARVGSPSHDWDLKPRSWRAGTASPICIR
jgi:hypothetical protein